VAMPFRIRSDNMFSGDTILATYLSLLFVWCAVLKSFRNLTISWKLCCWRTVLNITVF